MGRYRHILLSLLFLLPDMQGMVCAASQFSPFTFHEARQTLAAADSVRVNEGRLYDDSLALAEAYVTTGKWRYIYPNDYARACYYYGYLLRQRGNQVAAMQAFIAGTHAPYIQRVVPLPWFNDYHILGRIYSNMGTMCHLVDEFQLSYTMYEHSAEAFRRACDTTLYYYQCNAMALELAEQKLHDETFALLNSIEQECADSGVLTKLWETKAILYRNIEMYDSVIYAARQLHAHSYYAASGYVMLAQAYWALSQNDSAIYYAEHVMMMPNASEKDTYNMLYILAFANDNIEPTEKLQLTEERSDIDKDSLDPLHKQLSHAIEILLQDRNKRPPYFAVTLFLLSICLIVGLSWILIFRIRRHKTRTMAEIETKHMELQHDIAAQQKKLYNETRREQQKQNILRQQSEKLELQNSRIQAEHTAREQQIVQDIENTCVIIRRYTNWDKKIQWKDYSALCEFINQHFYLLADKLIHIYHLDEKEMRLSILVLMDMFNNDSLARILHYGKGIRTCKSRLNAKLGNTGKDLRSKLIQIAVSSS